MKEKKEKKAKGKKEQDGKAGSWSFDEEERRRAARARHIEQYDPERRYERAMAQQALRDARTPEQQLRVLDQRLGIGVGAKTERARLEAEIAAKS